MSPTMTKLAGSFCLVILGCAALCFSLAYSDEPAAMRDAKAALAPLQGLVGEWNGTGQPRRGSNVGAWSEQSAWAWHFATRREDGKALPTAELRASFKDGKYFSQFVIEPTAQAKNFRLVGTLPDGKSTETYDAELDAVARSSRHSSRINTPRKQRFPPIDRHASPSSRSPTVIGWSCFTNARRARVTRA